MSSQFYSSYTYNSPVKKEDYERNGRRNNEVKVGKEKDEDGGAKGHWIVNYGSFTRSDKRRYATNRSRNNNNNSIANGISADGIPIKIYQTKLSIYVHIADQDEGSNGKHDISNNADPAEPVDRRKKIAKTPSMPNIKISVVDIAIDGPKWSILQSQRIS